MCVHLKSPWCVLNQQFVCIEGHFGGVYACEAIMCEFVCSFINQIRQEIGGICF